MSHSIEQAALKLLLHRAAPAYEVAWMVGYDAGRSDKPESDNPYPQAEEYYKAWNEGWWAGFYGEEPLYEERAPQLASTQSIEVINITNNLQRQQPAVVSLPLNHRLTSQETTRWMFFFALLLGCMALYAVMAAE